MKLKTIVLKLVKLRVNFNVLNAAVNTSYPVGITFPILGLNVESVSGMAAH